MVKLIKPLTQYFPTWGIPALRGFSFSKRELAATISDHKNEEYITILDNKLPSNDAS